MKSAEVAFENLKEITVYGIKTFAEIVSLDGSFCIKKSD